MYSKAMKRMNLLLLLVLFLFGTNVAIASSNPTDPVMGSVTIDFQSSDTDDEPKSGDDDEEPEC